MPLLESLFLAFDILRIESGEWFVWKIIHN
jgi:hypothetical protein